MKPIHSLTLTTMLALFITQPAQARAEIQHCPNCGAPTINGRFVGDRGNADERRGPPPHVLEMFDEDGDGELSGDEREKLREGMKKRRSKMIEKYDKDSDGKLNRKERRAMIRERMDKDGDGKISEQERERARKRIREHRQKMERRGGREKGRTIRKQRGPQKKHE